MKAYSETSYPRHLVGPAAGVLVALGGAALVAGAMLLVGVRELNLERFLPAAPSLQSLTSN